MKCFFQGPLPDNGRNILRQLSYGEQRTRAGKVSYTKRITGTSFPHYHVYLEETPNGIQINLHLDQKEASYEGTSAHAGEYDGPLVTQEMNRITVFIEALRANPNLAPHTPTDSISHEPSKTEKKGFWEMLFGG